MLRTDFLSSVSRFIPHPLVRGGHMQTLIARFWDPPTLRSNIESYQSFIKHADGDRCLMFIDAERDLSPAAPIVVLFHGLGGDSDSSYMVRLSNKFTAKGFRVIRHNHRGCGTDQEFLARGVYHSASYDDVKEALRQISEMFPKAMLSAIGFSLSGTMMLNMVGRYSDLQTQIPQLKNCVAVSAPVDLTRSAKKIVRLSNAIYDQYFTRMLKNHVARRAEFFGGDVYAPKFPRFMNLMDFDHNFTAFEGGFVSGSDYYDKASPLHHIGGIKTPTLVVAAKDDPVIDQRAYTDGKFGEGVSLLFEKSGGHMGFLGKSLTEYGDRRWLDDVLLKWVISA